MVVEKMNFKESVCSLNACVFLSFYVVQIIEYIWASDFVYGFQHGWSVDHVAGEDVEYKFALKFWLLVDCDVN